MRSATVLALLLCAGQAVALPVNSPMSKGDTEVMRCIVEVISDTLSKPSPMPVSQECFETLRGDARILSILRHQNLLKELQDLALQGAKERAHQQKKHSDFEDELSEVLEKQTEKNKLQEVMEEASYKDTVEKRGDSKEAEDHDEDIEDSGTQGSPPPVQGSEMETHQAPGEEEIANSHHPGSPPDQKHPGPQVEGVAETPPRALVDTEDVDAGQGLQAKKEKEEEEEEEEEDVGEKAEAAEKSASEEEAPTAALNPHLDSKEIRNNKGQSEALATEEARKMGSEEAQPPEGKEGQEYSQEEEGMAGAPESPFRDGKDVEPEEEEGELSKEWDDAKRWSKMDQLAKELTAEKRLAGEDTEDDDPDRSMKLPFRTRTYGFRGPGPQIRRGWRPSSEEDSVEAGLPLPGRGYPEEKKDEEGSANRRPEDQELESLSVIEAELEKVAHQLQALRRG
ncbi:PREDICTED: chromogranin-A [Elephantulus edwardii]|uniref:chromogranin-A n=1 Tax=Elephantulus edwardii TaxID=28737 RepID=UPI0003F05941|nr:PREDICTED: chromogranin-A [Elephantulus edwardii]